MFDWLLALDIASTAIMFIPGVGTAAGAAIKVALVATRLVVGAVRMSAQAAKVTRVASAAARLETRLVRELGYQAVVRARRVGSALQQDRHHRIGSWVQGSIRRSGSVARQRGNDGKMYTHVSVSATVNGRTGIQTWIVRGGRVAQPFRDLANTDLGAMKKTFEDLDVLLFSRPLVERLLTGDFLAPSDVVPIETARLASGLPLDEVELRLAYLLSDELNKVVEILGECREPASLERQDRQVYLWLQLIRVRANWSQLVDPQFYLEELLDEFDHEDAYADMRFFRPLPRRELTPEKYLMRVDAVLADRQRELNGTGVSDV